MDRYLIVTNDGKDTDYSVTDQVVTLLQNAGKTCILCQKYEDKNIILQPDGDGNWFWKKFGFIPDNISKHLTLILQRHNELS